MAHSEYCDRNSKGSCRRKQHLFLESLKAIYVLGGIGSRSVPVGRQAGQQAGRRKRDLIGIFKNSLVDKCCSILLV